MYCKQGAKEDFWHGNQVTVYQILQKEGFMGLQCAYLIHLERLLMTPRGLHADQTKWASHAIKGAANFSLPPHFSLGLSLTVFLHFLPSP